MKIKRINAKVLSEYIRAYVYENMSKQEAALIAGVSRQAIHRYLKRNERLAKHIEALKYESISTLCESGLITRARGIESHEVTHEYINDEGVKVTERIRKDAPDYKAIQVLARKYNVELSDAPKDTNKLPDISMHINIPAMNTRELRELNSNSNPLGDIDVSTDAYEYVEVEEAGNSSSNSNDLEDSTPPSEDSNEE